MVGVNISERDLLDEREIQEFIDKGMDPDEVSKIRRRIWSSVDSILSKSQPALESKEGVTGLALGYVQSGKTTSIISLIAAAHDAGYRIVIGLMATNENLLRQNANRILKSLDIEKHGRKIWYTFVQDGVQSLNSATEEDIRDNIQKRGRTALILVMKNTSQINKVARLLDSLDTAKFPVLIVDDEADSVSLNTLIKKGLESATHSALTGLRKTIDGHLYVQYTATPYANLLLTPDDHLAPDFVEILEPGTGYTGGYSFFVENEAVIFRNIGAETMNSAPNRILPNMEKAIANFFVGAALLLASEGQESASPVSMLINPHEQNLIQKQYMRILKDTIDNWSTILSQIGNSLDLPLVLREERYNLVQHGVPDVDDAIFIEHLKFCFREYKIWLMNQTTSGQNIKWEEYSLHILLGANKLDRGFTVEGLTVTYMNRKASGQIDTMQQRSRAFGYRPYIKYCRVFTTTKVKNILKDTVYTERDLREQLKAWVESGRSFKEWAKEIGIIISTEAKPTRDSVVKTLVSSNLRDWQFLLNPNFDLSSHAHNQKLIETLGVFDFEPRTFGKHEYRTGEINLDLVVNLMSKWRVDFSPGWDQIRIKRALEIAQTHTSELIRFRAVLIDSEVEGGERTRSKWSPTRGLTGSDQLMQGSNGSKYPGDRYMFPEDENVIQFHRIRITSAGAPAQPLWFMALRMNSRFKIVRSA